MKDVVVTVTKAIDMRASNEQNQSQVINHGNTQIP